MFPFGIAVWTDLSTNQIIETGAVGITSEEDDFIASVSAVFRITIPSQK